MNLTILTPEREVFKGAVTSVKVPGASGEFEILANHAAIVSALEKGKIRVIKADGSKQAFIINSGFVEVLKNEVAVLVQGLKEMA